MNGLCSIVFSKAPLYRAFSAKAPILPRVAVVRTLAATAINMQQAERALDRRAGPRGHGRLTVGLELGCSTDFGCRLAHNVAHMLADIVMPGAGRDSLELGAQIDRGLSSEPSGAGLAVDGAPSCPRQPFYTTEPQGLLLIGRTIGRIDGPTATCTATIASRSPLTP
jgi:hypothetical protein